jgi:hypothetical protein
MFVVSILLKLRLRLLKRFLQLGQFCERLVKRGCFRHQTLRLNVLNQSLQFVVLAFDRDYQLVNIGLLVVLGLLVGFLDCGSDLRDLLSEVVDFVLELGDLRMRVGKRGIVLDTILAQHVLHLSELLQLTVQFLLLFLGEVDLLHKFNIGVELLGLNRKLCVDALDCFID